jgi:hypothetical protein
MCLENEYYLTNIFLINFLAQNFQYFDFKNKETEFLKMQLINNGYTLLL